MNLNGSSINMITAEESIVLYIIDSIEDKKQQRDFIEKVIAASKKKKLKSKVEAVVNHAYTMTEVLGLKQDKPLSIQDLRTEINSLKIELVQLRRRIEILELANKKQKDDDSDLKLFENSELNIGESSNTPQEYLIIIEQIISIKYVLRIKIIIN